MGVGSLAAYGRPGQNFTYYEIDPDVVELARNPKLFTFLRDCKANLSIKIGDARLELAKSKMATYALIVLDAFSSDSIPVHLLTREAVEMYLTKLAPGGLLAFHISNRYLDLKPVLGNEAASLGLRAKVFEDDDADQVKGKYPSIWVAVVRSDADFGMLAKNPSWMNLEPNRGSPLWTDDYSNLFGALKIFKHEPGE